MSNSLRVVPGAAGCYPQGVSYTTRSGIRPPTPPSQQSAVEAALASTGFSTPGLLGRAVIAAALLLGSPATWSAAAESTDPQPREPAPPAVAEPEPTSPSIEAAYQFARAKLLADSGSFEEALTAFRRALELDGSDPYGLTEVSKFHAYLAQISQSQRKRLANLEAAAEYAARAREIEPENHDILRSFAQLHMRLLEQQQDSLDLARDAFETLRQQTEGDLQVLISLGQIYLWQRDNARAAEVLKEAARFRPDHPAIQEMLVEALLATGDKQDAVEFLERIVERDPSAIEERLQLADLYSDRGGHRQAVELLKSGPQNLFLSPRLRHLLARELYLSGANEEALAVTETLLEDSPTGYGLRRLRVAILSAMARYREAIAELEPLIDESTDETRALQDKLFLSRLLERIDRPDEAEERMRGLAEKASGRAGLQAKMGLLALLERQGFEDEAVAVLSEELAAASDESVGGFSRMLNQLLARLGRDEEALAALDQTIERMTAAGDAEGVERSRLQKLTLLIGHEEWQQAHELASELLAVQTPEIRAAAYLHEGEILAALGRIDEALALLESGAEELGGSRAARQAPRDPVRQRPRPAGPAAAGRAHRQRQVGRPDVRGPGLSARRALRRRDPALCPSGGARPFVPPGPFLPRRRFRAVGAPAGGDRDLRGPALALAGQRSGAQLPGLHVG